MESSLPKQDDVDAINDYAGDTKEIEGLVNGQRDALHRRQRHGGSWNSFDRSLLITGCFLSFHFHPVQYRSENERFLRFIFERQVYRHCQTTCKWLQSVSVVRGFEIMPQRWSIAGISNLLDAHRPPAGCDESSRLIKVTIHQYADRIATKCIYARKSSAKSD